MRRISLGIFTVVVLLLSVFVIPYEAYADEDFIWQKTGEGTSYYAEFPSGYYTESPLYKKYNVRKLDAHEDTYTKREVKTSRVSWIYWHWAFRQGATANGKYNFFINSNSGPDDAHDAYPFFADFESAENFSENDPDGHHDKVPGLCYYHWRGNVNDGSWWWFRLPVYKQKYTDYKKVFLSKDISDSQIESRTNPGTAEITDNGKPLEENVNVYLNGKLLRQGTDYTIDYDHSVRAGDVDVTVTGNGEYEGSVKKTFKLIPKSAAFKMVTASENKIIVYWDQVSGNVDGYQVEYSNNSAFTDSKVKTIVKSSTGECIINDLTETATYYFRIRTYCKSGGKIYYSAWSSVRSCYIQIKENYDLSKAIITPIEDRTYTGKAITPEPTIVNGTYTLVRDIDFTVSYKDNVKIGTAAVTLTGIGKYYGTASTSFRIVPKKSSISKCKASSKKIVVRWKKQSKNCSGYQIRYSASPDFENCKTKTIKGKNHSKCTLKSLKAGTKYYIQIRTYCIKGNEKICSKWSKCVSISTKKAYNTKGKNLYRCVKYGKCIYFRMSYKIVRYNLRTGKTKVLVTMGKHNYINGICIRNGVLYFGSSVEDEGFNIYRVNLNGKKLKKIGRFRNLKTFPEGRCLWWGANSKRIYYARECEEWHVFHIYSMRFDGSDKRVEEEYIDFVDLDRTLRDYGFKENNVRAGNTKGYRIIESFSKNAKKVIVKLRKPKSKSRVICTYPAKYYIYE